MLYKRVLMINLGYMSSLRLGPGSALGEKLELKVRFVNQKTKRKKNGRAKEAKSEEGKGSSGVRPGKGWRRLCCPSLFPSSLLNSMCSPKFFLFDPFLTSPPPAEPSPRLEPSSGNSNFVYQSPTFSKDPFFLQLHQF